MLKVDHFPKSTPTSTSGFPVNHLEGLVGEILHPTLCSTIKHPTGGGSHICDSSVSWW